MDELVKRIDARIAELEAQENKDKEQGVNPVAKEAPKPVIQEMAPKPAVQQPTPSIFAPTSLKSDTKVETTIPQTKVEQPTVPTQNGAVKETSTVQLVNEPKEQSKNYINDDQFFDDFFNDD